MNKNSHKKLASAEKMTVHGVEKFSNNYGLVPKSIPELKKKYYWVEREKTVSGDAPKQLLHIYTHSKNNTYHKINQKNWPLYIAKTGHKWYPNESITEYLLNRLGEVFGLEMAESGLLKVNGQVRFLSKYFLKQSEVLVHGAEIFAGYLSDKNFVEQVEKENLSRDFFTLQFVEKAVKDRFPDAVGDKIMQELIKLLLFDALVGNNDRHFYNWAVIQPLTAGEARFSPIYDTARGLFWNDSDQNLEKWSRPNLMQSHVEKYSKASKPKLGWVGVNNITHFQMVDKIWQTEFYITQEEMRGLFSETVIAKMRHVIETEFSQLFTSLRRDFIIKCLEYRYKTIKEIIS